MSRVAWRAWPLLGVALAVLIGLRIGALGVDDVATMHGPQPMRSTYAGDPANILHRARQQLAANDLAAAASAACAVLRREPLQSDALVLLARVTDAIRPGGARALFEVALDRAPRDQYARAWMIATQLHDGEYRPALANIDKLLGFAPWQESVFLPIMDQFADRPAFAAALVKTLRGHPAWREALLEDLLHKASHSAADAVYGGLQDAGDLSPPETGAWLNRLMQAGLWGEAYTRWVGGLQLRAGESIPLVYNGDFARAVTGIGFDWRIPGAPGVIIERVAFGSAKAVSVTFLGRRVPAIGFAQTLLLAPGRYRLQFATSASDLRSDRGIQWAIRCRGGNPMQATSQVLQGSFDWRQVRTRFTVPGSDCPAQELVLINPGADGAGKIVAGTLWFTDFAIQPLQDAQADR